MPEASSLTFELSGLSACQVTEAIFRRSPNRNTISSTQRFIETTRWNGRGTVSGWDRILEAALRKTSAANAAATTFCFSERNLTGQSPHELLLAALQQSSDKVSQRIERDQVH